MVGGPDRVGDGAETGTEREHDDRDDGHAGDDDADRHGDPSERFVALEPDRDETDRDRRGTGGAGDDRGEPSPTAEQIAPAGIRRVASLEVDPGEHRLQQEAAGDPDRAGDREPVDSASDACDHGDHAECRQPHDAVGRSSATVPVPMGR